MVFPTHGYRGATLRLPCFCDILPWRRPAWAMLALGVASPGRRLMLTFSPDVDFDLDFVNARIRDDTQAPQS